MSIKKVILSSLLFVIMGLFFFVNIDVPVVQASEDVLGTSFIDDEIVLSDRDPREMVAGIINFILTLLAIIAVVIVIYGGFVWTTSGGSEDKISKAKNILKAGVIGLAIVLSAWGVTTLVLGRLFDITGVGTGGDSTPTVPVLPPGSGGDQCGVVIESACVSPDDADCADGFVCSSDTCTCEAEDEDEYSDLGGPCDSGGSDACVSSLSCNPEHGLTCVECLCQGSPIITAISPMGGFCENDINLPCQESADCGGGTCNTTTANAAAGNFISIHGYNFGEYNSAHSAIRFIDSSDDSIVQVGQLPSDLNINCQDFWSNTQVIIAMPSGFSLGDDLIVELVRGPSESDTSNNEIGPDLGTLKFNSIERPGLCNLSPDEARTGGILTYQGIKLQNAYAYFGNLNNNYRSPLVFSNNNTNNISTPNIQRGDVTSFAQVELAGVNIFSNFLDFKKLADLPSGPSVSFFEPATGQAGQYVNIYGSGFGSSKGQSTVHFKDVNSEDIFEASFDFPPVCLGSVWRDDQIIVKMPELTDGQYEIVVDVNYWDPVIANTVYLADSSADLLPSLCRVSPNMGPAGTTNVRFWGEYFGDNPSNLRAVFYQDKFSEYVTSIDVDNGAQRVSALMPEGSITGPVRISRAGVLGNSMDIRVGSCESDSDCLSAEVCCPLNTAAPGSCQASLDDCYTDIPESSVFQWSFNTDFSTQGLEYSCATLFSCPLSNYYVCPNSPGQCSPYEGGNDVVLSDCDDSCNSYDYCQLGDVNCLYDIAKDKCVSDTTCPSVNKLVEYDLQTGEELESFSAMATCKRYEIPNVGERFFYEIVTPGSCPENWSRLSNNRCVDSSLGSSWASTCSLCADGFSCSSDGFCESPKVCPANASCQDVEGETKCVRPDVAGCECCCDITENTADGNPSCCSPLQCANSCGISANTDNGGVDYFGLCSGCAVGLTDQADMDAACNCTGTSGKFCYTGESEYPEGVCLDCTSLKTKDACNANSTTCCWDERNDICRGGASETVIVGYDTEDNPITEDGYCPYYVCDNDNPTMCSSLFYALGDYTTQDSCDESCSANCAQFNDNQGLCMAQSNCCYDAAASGDENSCVSVVDDGKFTEGPNIGFCKRYDCVGSGDGTVCDELNPLTTGSYLNKNLCITNCPLVPSGFNEHCFVDIDGTACSPSVCNSLDCLDEDGNLGSSPNCGFCCCDPANDQCPAINEKLSCYSDRGNCTGENRGLCCGCDEDVDCASAGLEPSAVGCGNDTCCYARPEIVDTMPNHLDSGVCHNASMVINFDQRMDATSFLSNNILLLEERVGSCTSGTYFIASEEYKDSIFAKIKRALYRPLNFVAQIFGSQAFANPDDIADKNKIYCAVMGLVEFRHNPDETSSAIFNANSLLNPGSKYFLIVRGDAALDGESGVLSSKGIGLNGQGFYDDANSVWVEGVSDKLLFNNLLFPNSHIISFTTKDTPATQGGICTVSSVDIQPESYLFSANANDPDEVDNNQNHSSFDSLDDHDKMYYADALDNTGAVLNPISGYSWTWNWEILNNNVLYFKDSDLALFDTWELDGNKRLVAVPGDVSDARTSVRARVDMDAGNLVSEGDGTIGSTMAYVFVCRNPWPARNTDGSWEPWRDTDLYGNFNYEFYYCRDHGSDTGVDDLPAFLSNMAVVRGPGLVRVCSNNPAQTCSNNSDCSLGGLCISSFLKEVYFFKLRMPKFVENLTAVDTGSGGQVNLTWSSNKDLVDQYRIYYKKRTDATFSSVSIDNSECVESGDFFSCNYNLDDLENYTDYEFKVTALSSNMAETNFSNVVYSRPTADTVPNVPSDLSYEILSYNTRSVRISWEAPADYEVAYYKIHRGVNPGVYGDTISTQGNATSATVSLQGTTNTFFYFAVSSVNPDGQESDYSQELVVDLFNCNANNLIDVRDGQEYETVQIGDQCWMAENLKYLPEVSPSNEAVSASPKYYVYDYLGTSADTAKANPNFNAYGVLYNWYAAMDNEGRTNYQDVCPEGWSLPSTTDFSALSNHISSEQETTAIATYLRSCRQEEGENSTEYCEACLATGVCATDSHPRWDYGEDVVGVNAYGFNALPAGRKALNTVDRGYSLGLWTSNDSGSNASSRVINANGINFILSSQAKSNAISVRCLKSN